jgi:hypothetical protein
MKEPEQAALFHDVGLRTKFAGIMGELETAFLRKPSTSRVDVYWRYLHTLDLQHLARAAEQAINETGRFPSIADMRKAAKAIATSRARQKRGQFQRVPGIHCAWCEDSGWRFWEGTIDNRGEVITVQQWRDRHLGSWTYRVSACPCRETNPNYQCDLDEKSSTPPDIDRNKAKQMMAKYVGRGTGRW